MPATAAPVDPDEVGGAGESKKRYLILISTVMTWASTKPLDPVTLFSSSFLLIVPDSN